MRVVVYDGTGKNLLGHGKLVGRVTTYAFHMPDGSLTSPPMLKSVLMMQPSATCKQGAPDSPRFLITQKSNLTAVA